jgi:endoglucanase
MTPDACPAERPKAPHLAVACALLLALLAPLVAPAEPFAVRDGELTDDGTPVHLFGVSWFGAETFDHVPHGLWSRDYQDMIGQMVELGFNAVRLPVCPRTLDNALPSSIDYHKNPGLVGLGGLEVLDRIIAELDRQGVYILLDHHRPDCQAISELWTTPSYSEQEWIDDLVFMAERYRGVARFIGIDLKNEPHGTATWGTGDPATDWNLAAERAAAAVLAVNPDILVFVEGVGDNPVCSSATNHWWGGNLEPQRCAPLSIREDKLVFSPHVYGPDVYPQPYFDDPAFPANLPAIWDQHFGFLAAEGHALVPGEFGGK